MTDQTTDQASEDTTRTSSQLRHDTLDALMAYIERCANADFPEGLAQAAAALKAVSDS